MTRSRSRKHTVGNGLEPFGHPDVEGVRRGVARVVVDRIPGGRHMRLTDDQCAVIGGHETGDGSERTDDRLRDPVVANYNDECRRFAQSPVRYDGQFIAISTELGCRAIDLYRTDREPLQVEVER